MSNKGVLGVISIILLAIGCFFCLFLSPGNGKSGDSYILSTSKKETTETTETTTTSVKNEQAYIVSFTNINEDVLLSRSGNNEIKFSTDDLVNTTWNITKTKNNKGEQCVLYSIDEDNQLIVSVVPECVASQPANVSATLNGKTRTVKIYIED